MYKAVKIVKALDDYRLYLVFENEEEKIFDVKPYLTHKAFEQLNDKALFNTVKIDGLSISWLNGADICPDELYNNSKSISE